MTTAVHCPLSVATVTGAGQGITGGSPSFTFTTNTLAKLFPAPSITVQLTGVVPFKNTVPGAGKQFTLAPEQLSEMDGAV